MFKTVKSAIQAGKRDNYCIGARGFAVYSMPNGKFNYFPYGQPPTCEGFPSKEAQKVASCSCSYSKINKEMLWFTTGIVK